MTREIKKEPVPLTMLKTLIYPYIRITSLHSIASIFSNFFFLQYHAAFLPGRIPVTSVDHPLDNKIPFLPGKVNIYLDFVAFWIRGLGFLFNTYGRRAFEPVRNFIENIGRVYTWAAEVYRKNLSTTKRPFYIGTPRFLLIHAVDPHLMCIPSLHVMVVIRTYTLFREIFKTFGDEARFAAQLEELRLGALRITEAVLYVKQHSVSCISAAMYAMTRFESRLFPPEEAERFVSALFPGEEIPEEANRVEIRDYIITLYRRFMAQGKASDDWKTPLLAFLNSQLL